MTSDESTLTSISVLGMVSATSHDGSPVRLSKGKRRLLSVLAASGPAGIPSDRAADELWEEALPAHWDAALRMAMSRLNRSIGPGTIKNVGHAYRLDVPVDRVDLWRLFALIETDPTEVDIDELVNLLALHPFRDAEPTLLLRAEEAKFEAVRIEALQRLTAEAPHRLTDRHAAIIHALVDERAWDGDLVRVAAQVAELVKSPPPRAAAPTEPLLPARPAEPTIGFGEVIERIEARIANDGAAVVTTPPGGGLSHALGLLADRLQAQGVECVHVRPHEPPHAAFGPMLEAFDEFEPIFTAYLASTEEDSVRTARCFTEVRSQLQAREQTICIVADDAHWLDSHSAALLRFLATADGVRVLVGSHTLDDERWTGLASLQLPRLTTVQIGDLLDRLMKWLTSPTRAQLAQQIAQRSDGFAGRIVRLIDATDPTTLHLPTSAPEGHVPSSVIARLSDDARRLGTAFAVAKGAASLTTLADLCTMTLSAALRAADELLVEGLLTELDHPDAFDLEARFALSSLLRISSGSQRRELHLDWTEYETDPAAIAWHLDAARPLVDDGRVARAYIAAGHTLLGTASYREAAGAFDRAIDLASDQVDTGDLIAFATSLDRSGAPSDDVRTQAFARAAEAHDAAHMLEAALSGLPEGERLDGDPLRLAMLSEVPAADLDEADRCRLLIAQSRQRLLSGDLDTAREAAAAAEDIATSTTQRHEAWLARRHVELWVPSGSPAPDLQPGEDEPPALRARILQAHAVEAVIAGRHSEARLITSRLVELTDELGDPLRSWHAQLLRALLLDEAGDFTRAGEVVTTAATEAARLGVAGATAAMVAQGVRRQWHNARVGAALPLLDAAPADVREPLLAQAAMAVELFGSGQREAATERFRQVVVRARRSRFAASVAGMLAPISELATERDLAWLRDQLSAWGGPFIVIGAGVASLGPTDSARALTAPDKTERSQLLHQAVAAADRSDASTWRIRTRIALYRAEGDTRFLDEAAALAEGTDIEIENWRLPGIPPLP